MWRYWDSFYCWCAKRHICLWKCEHVILCHLPPDGHVLVFSCFVLVDYTYISHCVTFFPSLTTSFTDKGLLHGCCDDNGVVGGSELSTVLLIAPVGAVWEKEGMFLGQVPCVTSVLVKKSQLAWWSFWKNLIFSEAVFHVFQGICLHLRSC